MALCFVLNVSAGFVALRLVNIPIFLCIRRTTTVFVMMAEFLVLHKSASIYIWCAAAQPLPPGTGSVCTAAVDW